MFNASIKRKKQKKGGSDQLILKTFPHKPVFGIYGNHDTYGTFESANTIISIQSKIMGFDHADAVKNFNPQKVDMDGLSFTGLEGTPTYSSGEIGMKQEIANNIYIPPADILLKGYINAFYEATDILSFKKRRGLYKRKRNCNFVYCIKFFARCPG